MGKVIDEQAPGLRNPELVRYLEHLLFQARAGHMVAGAFVVVNAEGRVFTDWRQNAAKSTVHHLSTGVHVLAARYDRALEGQE